MNRTLMKSEIPVGIVRKFYKERYNEIRFILETF